jgi:hypothetical protein
VAPAKLMPRRGLYDLANPGSLGAGKNRQGAPQTSRNSGFD